MDHSLPARLDREWYRKQAKTLVRAFAAGDAETVARVEATFGARARERFRLSDAQWLIAQELGHRSWAEFAHRVEAREPEPAPVGIAASFVAARASWGERGGVELDSGLRYGGGAPVLVHVSKRDARYVFSDRGAAIEAAGGASGWREAADRLVDELDVNISRRGVVFLPAVDRRGIDWLSSLPARIAEASIAFYGALLELDQ